MAILTSLPPESIDMHVSHDLLNMKPGALYLLHLSCNRNQVTKFQLRMFTRFQALPL